MTCFARLPPFFIAVALAGCSYSERPAGALESVCSGSCCDSVVLTSGATCQTCRDSDGNVTGTNCPNDCGLCVSLSCRPSERLVSLAGQCCPTCVPANDCGDSVCVSVVTIACPTGQHPERDATDCCREVCVFDACSGACPDDAELVCPPHYRLDPASPPCCSVCVPDGGGGCAGDEDCDTGFECISGVCQVGEHGPLVTCPQLDQPNPLECQGYWRVDADTQGCPLEPVCICADLYPATSGTSCQSHCALDAITCGILDLFCDNGATVTRNPCNPCCPRPATVCSPPPRACDSNSDCTGEPVPSSECIAGYCGARRSGLDGRATTYNGETICVQPDCRADQVVSFGTGCCPTCLDVCTDDSDCRTGTTCQRDSLSTCAVQACHLGSDDCGAMTECFGVCQ